MNTLPFSATITWLAIGFCISQSAMFSGLNLALFSISRMRLEVETAAGNADARKILDLRQDSNLLLTTILWGNVGINVLLTLLSNSVMAGLAAFIFSTFVITFIGEIIPQAYFSRHAIRAGARLAPLLRVYRVILYPVAKPCAMVLDRWLGAEGIHYFRERDLREVIRIHMDAEDAEVDHVEGAGALNFLAIDDLPVAHEGEPVDPKSILTLPFDATGRPLFPDISDVREHPFVDEVNASGKKWVILVDPSGQPRRVLDADGFLRKVLIPSGPVDPFGFCHRPVVVTESETLGRVLGRFRVHGRVPEDDVIDQDIILMWGPMPRIITGADILGRLLRGIAETAASAGNGATIPGAPQANGLPPGAAGK